MLEPQLLHSIIVAFFSIRNKVYTFMVKKFMVKFILLQVIQVINTIEQANCVGHIESYFGGCKIWRFWDKKVYKKFWNSWFRWMLSCVAQSKYFKVFILTFSERQLKYIKMSTPGQNLPKFWYVRFWYRINSKQTINEIRYYEIINRKRLLKTLFFCSQHLPVNLDSWYDGCCLSMSVMLRLTQTHFLATSCFVLSTPDMISAWVTEMI